jgi:hypothetical protein
MCFVELLSAKKEVNDTAIMATCKTTEPRMSIIGGNTVSKFSVPASEAIFNYPAV